MPLKIVQRGAIWYIRGTVAGERVYESTGLSDKRAAEAKRARREAEIVQRSALGRSATLTFAEAALVYQEGGGEGRYLGPIIKHFGPKTRLVDIGNREVNAAAKALYPDAAPATINRQIITPISAVVHNAAMDDPSLYRRFKRRPEPQGRTKWLKPEEAERLIISADPRMRMIIMFLIGTGCRVSEALGLDAGDLHLSTGEAWVGRTKNKEPRMVAMPMRLTRSLRAAGLPTAGRVFRTPKGEPYKLGTGHGGQIESAFENARDLARLGPDVTPHVLRHTFATWYYSVSKDLVRLMAAGGWKKADMAVRYTKLAPRDLPERLLKHGWDFNPAPVLVRGEEPQRGMAG